MFYSSHQFGPLHGPHFDLDLYRGLFRFKSWLELSLSLRLLHGHTLIVDTGMKLFTCQFLSEPSLAPVWFSKIRPLPSSLYIPLLYWDTFIISL